MVLGAQTAAGGVTVKVGGVQVPQFVTVIGMLSVYEGQPGVGLLTVRLYVVDAVGQTVGVNVLVCHVCCWRPYKRYRTSNSWIIKCNFPTC